MNSHKLSKMENVKDIQIRNGVDAGYHNSNINPIDREGCVGARGLDKSYTLEQVLTIAHKIEFSNRPNIIIKAGPKAKWYMKRFDKAMLENEINKQKWRDTSRCTMYIIDWKE